MLYNFFSGNGRRPEDATLVDAIALDLFGGFTRLETMGGWRGPNDTVYQESGVMWIIDTPHTTASRVFAQQMRRILHQEAILVVAYPDATSRLVTGEEEDK